MSACSTMGNLKWRFVSHSLSYLKCFVYIPTTGRGCHCGDLYNIGLNIHRFAQWSQDTLIQQPMSYTIEKNSNLKYSSFHWTISTYYLKNNHTKAFPIYTYCIDFVTPELSRRHMMWPTKPCIDFLQYMARHRPICLQTSASQWIKIN